MLSLKQRLERLVAVATQKERERRRDAAAGAARGARRRACASRTSAASSSGSTARCTSSSGTATCRSRACTRSRPTTSRCSPASRSSRASTCSARPFLDTETTGLAGGTGTAAFLIGLGWFEGDRFRVRQYFMRDYHEEAALLRGARRGAARASTARHVQRQDVRRPAARRALPPQPRSLPAGRRAAPRPAAPRAPAVEGAARVVPAAVARGRRCSACGAAATSPARRSRRSTSTGCAGATPGCWRGSSSTTARTSSRWPRSPCWPAAGSRRAAPRTPRDVFSLARVLERARLFERSEAEYRRALEIGRRRAARHRRCCGSPGGRSRRGEHERAAELWAEAGEAGEPEGWRELADAPRAPARRTWPPRSPRSSAASRSSTARRQTRRVAAGTSARSVPAPPRRRLPQPISRCRKSTRSWISTGFLNTAIPDFSKAGISGECV